MLSTQICTAPFFLFIHHHTVHHAKYVVSPLALCSLTIFADASDPYSFTFPVDAGILPMQSTSSMLSLSAYTYNVGSDFGASELDDGWDGMDHHPARCVLSILSRLCC